MNTADAEVKKTEIVASKANHLPNQETWKSYDTEDINLLFNIIYRAIFNEDIFSSSSLLQKELLIDGEDKEIRLPNMNKVVKMITEDTLKQIVSLDSFEAIVKIIFEEKYPNIKNLKLDSQAIIENILKNFKSIEDPLKVENEEGEATNQAKEMEQCDANLNTLRQNLENIREKLRSFEKQVQGLPQNVTGKFTKEKGDEVENKTGFTSGESLSTAGRDPRGTSSVSIRKDSRFTKSAGEKNRDQSVRMSNDSSVSNGNGSHERNNLEENEKEAFDGESSDYYEGMGVHEKTKLPKKATDILKTWFLNNIDHPYPTVETKEMLCKATGLNKKQRFLEPLRKKLENEEKGKSSNLLHFMQHQGQQNNADLVPIIQPPQLSQSQKSFNLETQSEPAHSLVLQSNPPLVQNVYSVPQTQVQPTFIPQPVIIQNPTMPISQNSFYYSATAQPMIPQNLGEHQSYVSNPTGQILVPAGFIPQPQTAPVLMSPTPQGAYVLVNRPIQNYVPVGMMPMNGGAYMVPVQNYQYPDATSACNNQNVVDFRGMYAQNLSTNFNTIHNNVFNNISHTEPLHPQFVSYPQPVYVTAKPTGMVMEENKNYILAPNSGNTVIQGSEGALFQQMNPRGQLISRQNSVSKGQEFPIDEREKNQGPKQQENLGNSMEYREIPLEKKIHKEEAGPPINAFKK